MLQRKVPNGYVRTAIATPTLGTNVALSATVITTWPKRVIPAAAADIMLSHHK
ncbi:hypothetical protein PUR29_35300 [Methylobacterium ajmalii]|jgi:hypothetical protein|uniref:Uncharacterized protein n=1 Tax=Methylobacterium ajmalii TaxID=2738439 RepID=A0ABV0A6M0_9HYPH|nr:hypothetical protein [uncultured Methylobacterium sp.]